MDERGSGSFFSTNNASPWTSALYVAATSLLYTCVLTNYLFQLIRARRLYKASKPFPFNPTIIAFVATATKIPSDVTKTPPGLFDHLLRLSGIFVFCVTMNLTLSTLVLMEDMSNMLGLIIYLVAEMIYLYTNRGSITSPFLLEQIIFSGVMFLLFLIMVSHCLAVPTVKRRIENKFRHRIAKILRKWENRPANSKFSFEDLKKSLEKYWWMAVTSNPDLALRAWGTPLVCAILTWGVVGLGFMYSIVLSVYREGKRWRVHLVSGNDRLAGFVFLFHAIFILTGLAACICQGLYFNPVLFKYRRWVSPFGAEAIVDGLFKVDDYRYEILVDWRHGPLPSYLRTKLFKMITGILRIKTSRLLKSANQAVIIGSNIVLTIAALVVFVPSKLLSARASHVDDGQAISWAKENDIRLRRAMHERLDIRRLMRFHSRWIESGRTRNMTNLLSLLQKHSSARHRLYHGEASNFICGEYLPHSWTLTILTLARIIDVNFRKQQSEDHELKEAITKMKRAVRECVVFSKMVDMTLGSSEESKEMREAVEKTVDQLGLNLDSRFFALLLDIMDLLLEAPSLLFDVEEPLGKHVPGFTDKVGGTQQVHTPSGTITKIRDPENIEDKESTIPTKDPEEDNPGTVTSIIQRKAKEKVEALMLESGTDRSPYLFVSNCLYRVAAGLNSQAKKRASGGRGGGRGKGSIIYLRAFQQYLADTMLACLTKLPLALLRYCSSSAFGNRESRARTAAINLGQAESILKFIQVWQEAQSRKELRDEIALDNLFRLYENDWVNVHS